MPTIERQEEGTFEKFTVYGNNLDILLWELKEEVEIYDLRCVELESRSLKSLVYPGSEFESSEDVYVEICKLRLIYSIISNLVDRIENAVKLDGTSKLKID